VRKSGTGTYHAEQWGQHQDKPPANFPVSAPAVTPRVVVDLQEPPGGSARTQPFTITGFAFDSQAGTGTGVDAVHLTATADNGSGAETALGLATYGLERPDVALAYGEQFRYSGWILQANPTPALAGDAYQLQATAHSTVSGAWEYDFADGQTVYINMPQQTATVTVTGSGTVTSMPAGINCPATGCSAAFPFGSTVTLTAVPTVGHQFNGWLGGCTSGPANPPPPCVLQMSAAQTATAAFVVAPPSIGLRYYHLDAIGSVRVITNEFGALVERHDYAPFGEDTAPVAGDPRRFAGKELDPETALHYFAGRYYRNVTGRFTTVDPGQASGTISDPQSWNAYAYARNNPLRFVDPGGTEYMISLEGIDDFSISNAAFGNLRHDPGAGFRFLGSGLGGYIQQLRQGAWVTIGTYSYYDPSLQQLASDISNRSGAVVGGVGLLTEAVNLGLQFALPVQSTLANCVLGGCSSADFALGAMRLPPKHLRLLGGLVPHADKTVAEVVRIRGGGGKQVRRVATHLQHLSLAKVAELAAGGDAEALTALKIAKDAKRLAGK
jgi:RHS repeat-associated protein